MNREQEQVFVSGLRQERLQSPSDKVEWEIGSSLRREAVIRRRREVWHRLQLIAVVTAACLVFAMGIGLFTGKLTLGSGGNQDQANQGNFVTPGDVSAIGGKSGLASTRSILAENRLQQRIDEGLVFMDSGFSARQIRYQFVDRVTWINPKTGDSLEVEIPREEIILLPVQTF